MKKKNEKTHREEFMQKKKTQLYIGDAQTKRAMQNWHEYKIYTKKKKNFTCTNKRGVDLMKRNKLNFYISVHRQRHMLRRYFFFWKLNFDVQLFYKQTHTGEKVIVVMNYKYFFFYLKVN